MLIYDSALDPHLSLLHLGLELSPTEKGDFRLGALALTQSDGSPVCDLRFIGGEVLPQLPAPQGLPAVRSDAPALALHFADARGVAATLFYLPLEDCDVVVRQMVLENHTGGAITLHRAMSFQLDLPRQDLVVTTLTGAWAREFAPQCRPVGRGRLTFGSTSGTSSHFCNPFFLVGDPDATETRGEIYGFNLLYSGSHCGSVEGDSYGMTRVMSGIQPEGFQWTLAPGERFATPQAVLTYSDRGRNGIRENFHRFVRRYILPPQWQNAPRPVLVNNWEATYFDFTPSKLQALGKKAAQLGAELFVLDDGWFGRRTDDTRGLGDFTVNPKKLPKGLHGLAAELQHQGLAFGLWVEPEMVSRDSALYEAHPDWVVADPAVSPSLSRHQLVLDLCRTEVQDYLIDALDCLLSQAPIAYVKWDMNRHHTDRFSPVLPEQGRFAHAWMLGFYRVLDTVTGRHPDVLFEGCASGGNRFDLGILRYMPQIWLSDDTDAWERFKMQTWASLAYPQGVMGCHVTTVPNHQTLRSTPLETRFAVACFGLFGYELDLTALTPAQSKAVSAQVAFYKAHRALFQQGQLYCIRTPDAKTGGGWIVVSEDRRQAAVLELRGLLEPNSAQPPLRLIGLDPNLTYSVTLRPQALELGYIRSLVNQVSPLRVNPDGLLVHLAQSLYHFPGQAFTIQARGDLLLHAGLRLPPHFSGAGYSEEVQMMPDFSARLWMIDAMPD